jgi:hypothetical protein
MNLELQQLDLRYEKLRTRKPEAERKLVASLAEIGQQVPVVVVRSEAAAQFVLVDGYKRVRALRRLGHDLVAVTCWDLNEAEALVLDRLMRTCEGATALEQGWLLHELTVRFGGLAGVDRRDHRRPASICGLTALTASCHHALPFLGSGRRPCADSACISKTAHSMVRTTLGISATTASGG